MSRGKRDIERTRRIVLKIKAGMLYKQIAFEENRTTSLISYTAKRYFKVNKSLELNELGLFLMNEEQLTLPLFRESTLRVYHGLRNHTPPSRARKRPRKLV